jgi:hypothetical protein
MDRRRVELTPAQIAALRARGVRNIATAAPWLVAEILAAPPARERYRRSTTTATEGRSHEPEPSH